jgi:CheY-like chemotaxis protein
MGMGQRIAYRDGAAESVPFLVVDDDEVSIMAIKRGFKKLEIRNPINIARDGQEALEILRGDSDRERLLPPYIVTLDINMPRMNGLEFLEIVRDDPELKEAVIFVLTTSDAASDIHTAYENNVAGYILKDNVNDSLTKALKMIGEYAELVILPD